MAALRSCSDCTNCSNCWDCSQCSDCHDCYRCSDCSYCDGCRDCDDCHDCTICSNCSGCYVCFESIACDNCSFSPHRVNERRKGAPDVGSLFVPSIPNIHRKIYDAASQPDALDMRRVHKCETTHCRAGWTVHLAGEAGYKLEYQTTPLFAAMQIYRASGHRISRGKFFASDAKALEDMKKLANR